MGGHSPPGVTILSPFTPLMHGPGLSFFSPLLLLVSSWACPALADLFAVPLPPPAFCVPSFTVDLWLYLVTPDGTLFWNPRRVTPAVRARRHILRSNRLFPISREFFLVLPVYSTNARFLFCFDVILRKVFSDPFLGPPGFPGLFLFERLAQIQANLFLFPPFPRSNTRLLDFEYFFPHLPHCSFPCLACCPLMSFGAEFFPYPPTAVPRFRRSSALFPSPLVLSQSWQV